MNRPASVGSPVDGLIAVTGGMTDRTILGHPPTPRTIATHSELRREKRRNEAADTAELLSVKQVAQMMSCGERTVYRMSDLGKMPAPVKIGGLVRWPRRVLVEWINAGCPAVRETPQAA